MNNDKIAHHGTGSPGKLIYPLLILLTLSNSMMATTDSQTDAAAVKTQRVTVGGGCFWCLDAAFRTLDGVKSVTCGYAGGTVANPDYKLVCTGKTGHAEVVQVEFEPARISLEKVFEFFWKIHDPTTLNRQGPDSGTQYRSIILYQDEAQKLAAERSKKLAAAHFSDRIVTAIVPLKVFYPAEDYHQNYFAKNPNASYCVLVIKPKMDKLKKH